MKMPNILSTMLYFVKCYVMFIICRFVCETTYKIYKISDKMTRFYEVLNDQNKKILNNEKVTLLPKQKLEYVQKNKSIADQSAIREYMASINFDDMDQ